MEFEFCDSLYIEPRDLREMFLLCKNKGYTPSEAVYSVACGFDDSDYALIGYVLDDVVKEIERRLAQSKTSKGSDKNDN